MFPNNVKTAPLLTQAEREAKEKERFADQVRWQEARAIKERCDKESARLAEFNRELGMLQQCLREANLNLGDALQSVVACQARVANVEQQIASLQTQETK